MLEKLNDAPFLIKIDVCNGFINSLSYLWLGCFLLQHNAQQFQQIQIYIVISVSSYLTLLLNKVSVQHVDPKLTQMGLEYDII